LHIVVVGNVRATDVRLFPERPLVDEREDGNVIGPKFSVLPAGKMPIAGGNCLYASCSDCVARPICFKLLMHCVRAAASRTFCTAGTNRAIKIAMMAITTNNSINVNA
jgi:hypothetical protein